MIKRTNYIFCLTTILSSHTRIMLIKYYAYYKLGYKYLKNILEDTKDREEALKNTKKMCIETVGSPYMDSKYKGSCIYGAKEAFGGNRELDLENFLIIFNKKHNTI